MSASGKSTESLDRSYSPFPPVLVVFFTMAVLQAISLKSNLDIRSQIKAAAVNTEKVAPQAKIINDTVEKVGRDLFALADPKGTNEAARIIREFNIRINNPPAPAQSTPPKK